MFEAKFNKFFFTFLIIVLSLNSSNIFTMKQIDLQNLSKKDKQNLIDEKNQVTEIKKLIEENGDAYYTEGLTQMLEILSKLKFLNFIPNAKNLVIKIKDLFINKVEKQLKTDKYLTENDLKIMLNGLMVLKGIKELKSLKETNLINSINEIDFTNLIDSIVIKSNELKNEKTKMSNLMNLAKKTGKKFIVPFDPKDQKKPTGTMYTGKTNKEINEINRAFN